MSENLDLYDSFLANTDVSRLQKVLVRHALFQMSLDVPGDIVECGVYKGSGIYTWAKLMRIFKPNNEFNIVGFDFFDTNREMTLRHPEDKECLDEHEQNWVPAKEIRANCERWGFTNIDLIEGNVVDTSKLYVDQHLGMRISLLYIDIDNYEGALACLKNFYPLVSYGGVVIFDEYALRGYGESDAVDEYFQDSPVKLRSITWGNTPTAYLIKGSTK